MAAVSAAVFLIITVVAIGAVVVVKSKKPSETERSGMDYMEGMQNLYAWNTYGFYFDFYSESDPNRMDDTILMKDCTEELCFMVESAGQQREMAVQILIDYVQVPVIVDDEIYTTYFFDADERFSQEFSFRFKDKIDENRDHKITAVLTVASDKYAVNAKEEYPSYDYSLAFDLFLTFENSSGELVKDGVYEYENIREQYEDMFIGLLINADLENFKRTMPKKEMTAAPGEQITLSYHAGGYEKCEEAIILLSLGMQQIQVNGQDFIIFKTMDGMISNGLLTITAPSEPGLYDLTGWIINDPYTEKGHVIPLSATPRFTLRVE